MSTPSRPDPKAFKALIVTDSTPFCTAFVNTFIKLPYLLYKMAWYFFDASGNLSSYFKGDVCAVVCTPTPSST